MSISKENFNVNDYICTNAMCQDLDDNGCYGCYWLEPKKTKKEIIMDKVNENKFIYDIKVGEVIRISDIQEILNDIEL